VSPADVGPRATVVQHHSRNQLGATNLANVAGLLNSGVLAVTNLANGGWKTLTR
jgi:hypothetical protein